MDPQAANMIRNITGFLIISHIYCSFMFFQMRQILQKNAFMWHLHGIMSVTYSIEVGVCICYLWTKHSCPGFILKKDWLNWCSWILILIFYMLIIMIVLKISSKYISFCLMILLFSVNFTNTENIIFSISIFRIFFAWFFSLFI